MSGTRNAKETAAEANRKRFPSATKMIDELKASFPDARVLYVEENGRSMGSKLDDRIRAGEFGGKYRAKSRGSRPPPGPAKGGKR